MTGLRIVPMRHGFGLSYGGTIVRPRRGERPIATYREAEKLRNQLNRKGVTIR